MRTLVILALCFAAVSAVPAKSQRIVGGSLATIAQYPSLASLLYTTDFISYTQACAGTLLNNRSVLTSASCIHGDTLGRWRFRLGSSYANSGGTIYTVSLHITHPGYSSFIQNNDIGILRSASIITYVANAVQPGVVVNAGYHIGDNLPVTAVGWGATSLGGEASEQLREVQLLTVSQGTCSQRYSELRRTITGNMLCAGWLDAGGRDQCVGDNGGPLFLSNVVVGVYSWGEGCGQGRYPGVNTRVPNFTGWIQANA